MTEWRRGALVAVALLSAAAAVAGAAMLTPAQLRGEQIYVRGEGGPNEEIVAFVGGDTERIPAAVMPCVNCHGYDGRGKAEGGLRPPDLTADSLARPSDGSRTNGRQRPAYTRSGLTRAVAMGIDAGGHELGAAMPRYRMSRAAMQDLIAYLQILGAQNDPGITGETVTIGVIAPSEPTRQSLAKVVARGNEDGIYGRRVELRFADRAASFAGQGEPFAVIDPSSTADATVVAAERARMPAIVASRAGSAESSRYAFELLGGLREELAALLAYARRNGPSDGLLILHDDASAALAREVDTGGWTHVERLSSGWTDVSLDAKLAGRSALLFLGPSSQLPTVLARAAAQPKPSLVLIPAVAIGGRFPSAPTALDKRLVVAFPGIPSEDAPRIATLAAAAVLFDAFEKIGRDLTREKLVDALEALKSFKTGWVPPITWSAARRNGTTGAYLMTADLQHSRLVAIPGWIDPRD